MVYSVLILLLVSIFGSLVLFFAGITMRKRLKNNPFMIIIMLAMLGSWITVLLFVLLYESDPLIMEGIIITNSLIMGLIFFNGYLYYELLLNLRPNFNRFSFFLTLFILTIIFSVIAYTDVKIHNELYVFSYLSGSITCIFVLTVIKKTRSLFSHKALKIDFMAISLLFVGTIFYIIHGSLVVLGIIQRLTAESTLLYSAGATIFIIASFLLLLNSVINGNYIHFLPVILYNIILYNEGGMMVYNKQFNPYKEDKKDDSEALMSGALMAFSSFFKEVLGTKAKLTYINANNFKFLFSDIDDRKATLVVVASRANYFLKKSIKSFNKNVPKDFTKEINKFGIPDNIEEEIDDIIKKSFPYLIMGKN